MGLRVAPGRAPPPDLLPAAGPLGWSRGGGLAAGTHRVGGHARSSLEVRRRSGGGRPRLPKQSGR
eukprot:10441405-Lingulodinium_polyedra.AAC.1